MTPDERITFLEQRLAHLEDLYFRTFFNDKIIFNKPIYLEDGAAINIGTANGTKIGTATTNKIGFFGATPVDQPETVNDVSGGEQTLATDNQARETISFIIDRLQELGLIQ